MSQSAAITASRSRSPVRNSDELNAEFWSISATRINGELLGTALRVDRRSTVAQLRVSLGLSTAGGVLSRLTYRDEVLPDGDILQAVGLHNGAIVNVVDTSILVAACFEDGKISVWHADSGRHATTLQSHNGTKWEPDAPYYVRAIRFLPNTHILIAASYDRKVRFWDGTNGECVKTFDFADPAGAHGGSSICSLAVSPCGEFFATGFDDDTAKVWSVDNGMCMSSYINSVDMRGSCFVDISPDGKLLATSSWRAVQLWDLASGTLEKTLEGASGHYVSFYYSGKALAVARAGSRVRLWSVSTGECYQTLGLALRGFACHPAGAGVLCSSPDRPGPAAFSFDGRLLAAASCDSSIKICSFGEDLDEKVERTVRRHFFRNRRKLRVCHIAISQ